MGLGRSGEATARFLVKQGAGVTVTDNASADSLKASVEALDGWDVRFRLGRHDEKDFTRADLVVISPGVPHRLPILESARAKGVSVVGEMALAAGMIAEPMIAITGTNGKTTTTELVGKMLENSGKRVFVGGNIGTPLISYLDGDSPIADVVVAEVSSFQLDTAMDFRPETAVMLNITEDHLDRYVNFTAYAESKWRIFNNQRPTDTAIVNSMDATITEMMNNRPPRAVRLLFSDQVVADGAQILENKIQLFEKGRRRNSFTLDHTGLTGPHNRENLAAACLAALRHDATDEGIQQTIDEYQGLSHRLEKVGEIDGIHFFNDSKATNVDAVRRALECFDTPVVLIMGGQNKKGDFTLLQPSIRHRVKTLVVMGEAKDEILFALSDACHEKALSAVSLEEAVEKALNAAKPGEAVLFSPACASFDMFDNYVHRGNRFREIVERLQ